MKCHPSCRSCWIPEYQKDTWWRLSFIHWLTVVVKAEEILSLLPPGHWPLLSLEVSFGQFREISEASHVRIVGRGVRLGSHQSVAHSAQPCRLVRIWHCWWTHGAEVSFVGLTPQWTCYLGTIPWPLSVASFQAVVSYVPPSWLRRGTKDRLWKSLCTFIISTGGNLRTVGCFPKGPN